MEGINHPREADTERRILEAAAKVFVQKGKLGASMQDIADQAGINRTLLHYYFRNKEKLFDTVFEKLLARIFPAMVGIMSSGRPFTERLEKFIEAYDKLLRENPFLPVFIFQELSLNPGRLADKIRGMGFDPGQAIKVLGAELEEAGMIDLDPRHIFANMMGMVVFPYIGRPLFQGIAFSDDEKAYESFLAERVKHVPHFMKLAFIGAGVQNKKP
jgi:AcrR family transcriptional regulator